MSDTPATLTKKQRESLQRVEQNPLGYRPNNPTEKGMMFRLYKRGLVEWYVGLGGSFFVLSDAGRAALATPDHTAG
jgi:hypothetical protein